MTKTEQIYELLKKRLRGGDYPVGSRFPSELRLADEFGINRKTANLIVAMLEKDGYVQRRERGGGTAVLCRSVFPEGYIAYLAPFSAFNNRILNGIQQCAREHGYAVIVQYVDNAHVFQVLNLLNARGIRGVIAAEFTLLFTDPLQYPVVVVDNEEQPVSERVGNVSTDNRRGGYDLMREILRRGHRRIVICTGKYDMLDRRNRVQGFMEAMSEAGIADPQKRVFRGALGSSRSAAELFDDIFQQYPETTLIACDSDEAAFILAKEALSRGIPVPEKLVITSYGNTISPLLPLASVEQSPEKIGEAAVSLLMDMIRKPGRVSLSERIVPRIIGAEHISDLSRVQE